jgi:hypothetical protein
LLKLSFPTTKTGRHDIAEILLKVAFKHKKSINQSSFSLEKYANSRGVEHDVPKTVVMYNKLMGGVDMADKYMRLRVECTLFVIYKAGREPTPYW